ncbi:MAG: response regulator [Spirochaeta sp.]|nr:response regulator [Spirochaeta sp.]
MLVVDDEGLICMRVKAALESSGYRVYLADNGADAVSLLSSHADIDLVLMDIQLDDGMNGGGGGTADCCPTRPTGGLSFLLYGPSHA